MEARGFHFFAGLLIALTGLIVYSNTHHLSFQFDDYSVIVDNAAIKDLGNIPQFFQRNDLSLPSRGIVTTTFAINYYFSGLSVEGYRWVNIFVHLLNRILVYSFVIITLGKCASIKDTMRLGRGVSSAPILALFVALMFITGPSQTHSITYIVKRYGPVSACFSLLSIMLFIKAAEGIRMKGYLYAGSVLSFLFAIWSKETAYMMPAILFLYYQCFIASKWSMPGKGLRLVSPYVMLAVVSFYLSMPLGEAPTVTEHTRVSYFLTQFNVIIGYIKLLLLPLPSKLSVDCYQKLVETIWEPPTLVSIIAITAILATAFLYFSRARLLAFSILWFFIMLLPTSSVIPLRETMVYYRLYLPGLGFYLFIVVGVHELFCYFHERKGYSLELVRRLELAVLFCIVVFYGACAHEHNKAWSTEITLWKDTVKKSPNKISSHYALGRAYQINGRIKEAMEEYLTCQELYANAPNIMDTRERKYSSSALNNLGFFYTGMKKYDKAIDILKKAIEINPMNANAHNNLGYAYLNMDRPEVAETKFNRAIEINPEHPRAHAHLAEVYESKGMPGQALSAYTKAVSVRSTNVAAWMRLGQLWLSYKKDPTRALQCLQEAQKVCKNEETLAEIKDIIGTIEGSGRAVPTPETGKSTD